MSGRMAETVTVPRDLLVAVLAQAEDDLNRVCGEFSCCDADRAQTAALQARIDALRQAAGITEEPKP